MTLVRLSDVGWNASLEVDSLARRVLRLPHCDLRGDVRSVNVIATDIQLVMHTWMRLNGPPVE